MIIEELPVMPTMSELGDLFLAHWEEVYNGDNPFPPDPDLELYGKLYEAGACFALFAKYEEAIVGYSINFLTPNMHCKGKINCNNDVLYVDPSFRDTPLGLKLIKKTEALAKEKGAHLMVWMAPLSTNLGKILPRLKYLTMETMHMKEL